MKLFTFLTMSYFQLTMCSHFLFFWKRAWICTSIFRQFYQLYELGINFEKIVVYINPFNLFTQDNQKIPQKQAKNMIFVYPFSINQSYQQKMKIYLTIIALILLVLQTQTQNSQEPQIPKFNAAFLPYQAHGFNNLDIARHLLTKGVKYFKFDASLANKQSCLKYSRWNNSNPCLNNTEYAQQMCCIAMRGDLGSQPNFIYPFNTSDQFVQLISSFLSKYHQSIQILFVAIDFQFGFAYTNKIAEKFMYDLATLMYKYPKVYFTAKGDYILQFDKVCRYHSFMVQADEACTPERNYISKSRFFLQSSSMNPVDSRDYKGRFQNFNTIYKDIDGLCSRGFPTWMNKYPHFPLIFWQPSNERQIQNSIRKLMDPNCRAKHNRSLSGIAFASNLEPQMFQVMMKQTVPNQNGFYWKFTQEKMFLQNNSQIKMAKIVDSNMQEQLVIYKKVESNKSAKHFLYVLGQGPSNVVSVKKFIEIDKEIVELRAVKNTIIAVTKSQNGQLSKEYTANMIAFNNQLDVTGNLMIEGYLVSYSSGDLLYFLSLTSNPQIFNIYTVNQTLKKPTQYKVSVFMERQKIQSITGLYFKRGERADQDITLIVGNNVNKTWLAQIKNSQEHKVKDLVFGTNARIISQTDSTIAIIVQNSYSHGGLLINNNAQNTCIYHKIDDLKPLATVPHLLNLLQGSVQDYIDFLDDNSTDVVTACNSRFTFTKIMNGGDSQIIQIWNYLFISTRFIPIQKQDFLTTLFTGGSNFQVEFRNKTGYLLSSLSTAKDLTKNQNSQKLISVQ